MIDSINEITVSPDYSILHVLKKMDAANRKLLLVLSDGRFIGVVSIGDIQRAIINNTPLDTPIRNILRNNPKIAVEDDTFDNIKALMLQYRMEFLPQVDRNQHLIKVFFWEDFFKGIQNVPVNRFSLPVVIMAGGLGSRMKPLTNVFPKPLIPINEKTMLEEIFDRFASYGCNDYYVSVNYKHELIEYYINRLNLPFKIIFFKEEKPLGTAGSLSLLKNAINDTLFVTNCDILIEQDYSEILKYHKDNNNEITIVAALKHYHIPYGVVETGLNGILQDIHEKPEMTLKINSGMYILDASLLEEIPENEYFNITDMIQNIQKRNGRVGVFPVSEGAWKDIGEWENYFSLIKSTIDGK